MASAARDFDLIVIGSGPAGEKAAVQAAYFGKRVCVVEKSERPGGACVNTGTLPSKSLRESALYLAGFAQRGLDGLYEVSRSRPKLSVKDLMTRKDHVIAVEVTRIKKNFERHHVEVVQGEGRFEDPHTIAVKKPDGSERVITGEIVMIATGTVPNNPPGIDFPDPDIDDSDSILQLDRIPETLTILGAGVIGCEYASIFAALGVKVTLVEGRDRLLPFLDFEISDRLAAALCRLDIDLQMGETAKHVERVKPGANGLRVKLNTTEIECDKLLFCGGRSSVTKGMGLEKIGITTDDRGRIAVSPQYRTSVPNVYATGDVIGFPSLASASMEQGRIAVVHAFDLKYKTHLADFLPYGIYTIPEISMVGETEETLKKKKIDYEVGRAFYRDNARAQIIGDTEGIVKLLFAAEDAKLLGVHIIGERATELVHIGMLCMQLKSTIDDFIQAIFNYPTLSDTFKYAAYDGLGRIQRRKAWVVP